jgi:L-amino acid N-acyltransferase YncA
MESADNKEPNIRLAEEKDVPQILEILRQNLAENLSLDQKIEGFLYYEPTVPELKQIINDVGILVATDGDEIMGYLMTMSRELAESIPFECELIEKLGEMKYDGKDLNKYRYVVLAQICIAKKYRGGMTFARLHAMKDELMKQKGYELGIAEIADQNVKSLTVHSFFTEVGTYLSSSGVLWHVVVQDFRR